MFSSNCTILMLTRTILGKYRRRWKFLWHLVKWRLKWRQTFTGNQHILFMVTSEFHPLPNGTFPVKTSRIKHSPRCVKKCGCYYERNLVYGVKWENREKWWRKSICFRLWGRATSLAWPCQVLFERVTTSNVINISIASSLASTTGSTLTHNTNRGRK